MSARYLRIRRALICVQNEAYLPELAENLRNHCIEIVAVGEVYKLLRAYRFLVRTIPELRQVGDGELLVVNGSLYNLLPVVNAVHNPLCAVVADPIDYYRLQSGLDACHGRLPCVLRDELAKKVRLVYDREPESIVL